MRNDICYNDKLKSFFIIQDVNETFSTTELEESDDIKLKSSLNTHQYTYKNSNQEYRSDSLQTNSLETRELRNNSSRLLKDIVINYQKIYNQQIEKEKLELYKIINLYNDENNEYLILKNKIIEIADKYSLELLGTILQKIVVEKYDRAIVLIGIGKSLERFDLVEVDPWGTMILFTLLNHREERVKEQGLVLLENWEDKSLLPLLRGIDCASPWLRKYINDIIQDLEG